MSVPDSHHEVAERRTWRIGVYVSTRMGMTTSLRTIGTDVALYGGVVILGPDDPLPGRPTRIVVAGTSGSRCEVDEWTTGPLAEAVSQGFPC